MDLESRLAQAFEELSHASTSDGSKRANKEWLPNEPAKYILIGHRVKISAVSFHPSVLRYSVGFCRRDGEDLGLGFRGIGEDVEESYQGGYGLSV